MSRRMSMSLRIDIPKADVVMDFAERMNYSPSMFVNAILPPAEIIAEISEKVVGAFNDENADIEKAAYACVHKLHANAARWEMLEFGIAKSELSTHTDDGILSLYRKFSKAKRAAEPENRDAEGQPHYRFESAPAGGGWEARGDAGKLLVLGRAERATKDGVELLRN